MAGKWVAKDTRFERHLRRNGGTEVLVSFEAVERVIGAMLPGRLPRWRVGGRTKLHRLLATLREQTHHGRGRGAKSARWAEARVHEREAGLAADALERRFAQERLSGDDGRHAFRSPSW